MYHHAQLAMDSLVRRQQELRTDLDYEGLARGSRGLESQVCASCFTQGAEQ